MKTVEPLVETKEYIVETKERLLKTEERNEKTEKRFVSNDKQTVIIVGIKLKTVLLTAMKHCGQLIEDNLRGKVMEQKDRYLT